MKHAHILKIITAAAVTALTIHHAANAQEQEATEAVQQMTALAEALKDADELFDPKVLDEMAAYVQKLSIASAALGGAVAVYNLANVIAGTETEFDVIMGRFDKLEENLQTAKNEISAKIDTLNEKAEYRQFFNQYWNISSRIVKDHQTLVRHLKRMKDGWNDRYSFTTTDMESSSDYARIADLCDGSESGTNVFKLVDIYDYGNSGSMMLWRGLIVTRLIKAQQVATYKNLHQRLAPIYDSMAENDDSLPKRDVPRSQITALTQDQIKALPEATFEKAKTDASSEVAADIQPYLDQCAEGFRKIAGDFGRVTTETINQNAQRFLQDVYDNARKGLPLHKYTEEECLPCAEKSSREIGKFLEGRFPGTSWVVIVYARNWNGDPMGQNDFNMTGAATLYDQPINDGNARYKLNIVARHFYPQEDGEATPKPASFERSLLKGLYTSKKAFAGFYVGGKKGNIDNFMVERVFQQSVDLKERFERVGWFWVAEVSKLLLLGVYVPDAAQDYVTIEYDAKPYDKSGGHWVFAQ